MEVGLGLFLGVGLALLLLVHEVLVVRLELGELGLLVVLPEVYLLELLSGGVLALRVEIELLLFL